MRLFFIIPTVFFAWYSVKISSEENFVRPLALAADTCKDVAPQKIFQPMGWRNPSFPNNFGYGVPYPEVISETLSAGGLIVQNSVPKYSGYVDRNGRQLSHCILWSRVINETNTTRELSISFPAYSFASFPSGESFFKLYLPPDTMSLNKLLLFDYGATGAKTFLDANINSPTMLKRTIGPKEDFIFYIGVVCTAGYDLMRGGLVVKDQELFYQVSGVAPEVEGALIRCGKLVEKH